MAQSKKSSKSSVLLGFPDEAITEKNNGYVNHTTNKIGGRPNWTLDGIHAPHCQLCGLVQPLVIQVYAPLDTSPYHRTLYVFGCINPNCWNQKGSWRCLRSQIIDPGSQTDKNASANTNKPLTMSSDWCLSSGDWDDEDEDDDDNGNVIANYSATATPHNCTTSDNESDDSSSLSGGLNTLNLNECNANWAGAAANDKNPGAVGKQNPPSASAEIEGDENELVCIDTPTEPQKDLIELIQEVSPLPYHLHTQTVQFVSSFISVCEESFVDNFCPSDHVRELIQEYQQNNEDVLYQGGDSSECSEIYEKSLPSHGDSIFHRFISKIQANPGQIIRYSRDSHSPLLLYPLGEKPGKCEHCGEDLVFEMQILPTLVSKLQIVEQDGVYLEFGTVLIYTCLNSCWGVGDKWREEKVIVQAEMAD